MPAAADDLRDILRQLPLDVAGVTPNWRIFGSSGHRLRPAGLMLEAYRRRAPDAFPPNRHVTSIVRPALAFHAVTTHQFLTLGRQVDGALRDAIPLAGQLAPPRYGALWINHYVVRSREDFARKSGRGRPELAVGTQRELPSNFFASYDRNEVKDRSVRRFLPALKHRLGARD